MRPDLDAMPRRVRQIAEEVAAEVERAERKHAPLNSPHEGWSVIYEELEELREHVRGDTGRSAEAREEAIQIAAMGLRYVLNLCDAVAVTLPPVPTHRHYRGGLYRVLHEATHSESGEPLIIYQSCADGQVWARPKAMFCETLPDGRPRFAALLGGEVGPAEGKP